MKQLIFVLVLFITASLAAQEGENAYGLYQTIYIKAKKDSPNGLMNAIKAHNDKYHNEAGVQGVNVWSITTGKRSGGILWVKGPFTWKDMDVEHPKEDHMQDWWQNVWTNSAYMGDMNFWRVNQGMAYLVEGLKPKVMTVSYFAVEENKMDNVSELIEKVVEVCEKTNFKGNFALVLNASNDGTGKDIALIGIYDSYTTWEMEQDFPMDYSKVHGEGAWDEFMERWNEATNFTTSEIRQLIPDLSLADN